MSRGAARLTKLFTAETNTPTFLDSLTITARGGRGGAGFKKFKGVGGHGGNVFILADRNASLYRVKRRHPSLRFFAPMGDNAAYDQLMGKRGEDVLIPVPPGTSAFTSEGRKIGDVNTPGMRLNICEGGIGGNFNTSWVGRSGELRCDLRLELKLLADVGLVGFPNAGKSALLHCLSRARPKVANYPFTTLRPYLGMCEYDDKRRISITDLPGLIEGAHQNVGLGHKFLRHIERTKVLLFVVDVNGFLMGQKYGQVHRTAAQTLVLLNRELELYRPALVQKDAVLAVNKIDLTHNNEPYNDICRMVERLSDPDDHLMDIPEVLRPRSRVRFSSICYVSAHVGVGIDSLKTAIRSSIDSYVIARDVARPGAGADNRSLDVGAQTHQLTSDSSQGTVTDSVVSQSGGALTPLSSSPSSSNSLRPDIEAKLAELTERSRDISVPLS